MKELAKESDKILYEGKSKIILQGNDSNSYILKFKDTATAFNGEKKEELMGKGALNAQISSILYQYLQKNGIDTHLIKVIDNNTWLIKKSQIIMVEVIVRNFSAGSFSKKYGIEEGAQLKNSTIEFSLKSDQLGDPMINSSQITAIGIATTQELDQLTQKALRINKLLSDLFFSLDITLVDFKLEFGKHNNEIILCDEISPDSCRLWDAKTHQKLDKDRFRQSLGNVLQSYEKVLKALQTLNP